MILPTSIERDECFHLNEQLFDHLTRMFDSAGRVPALLLCGDKAQMGSPSGRSAFHSLRWARRTGTVTLTYSPKHGQRLRDQSWVGLLNRMRHSRPTSIVDGYRIRDIIYKHRAWAKGNLPTVEALRRILTEHPETTILACSRRGCRLMNALAVEALLGSAQLRGELAADVESNPDNYGWDGEMLPHSELRPMRMRIYVGMKVTLTRNVCKENDFVNGMLCEVEDYDGSVTGCV